MMKNGLDPIISKSSKILILGSLPSDKSILNQEYYNNPVNHFWRLISFVFENKYIDFESYEEKKSFLNKHNIALWDVIKCANRKGSLDNNITNEEFNDLIILLDSYNIDKVFVNGRKAESSLKKYMKENNVVISYKYLPSSSSLNAKYNLNDKAKEWKKIINN